MVYAWSDDKKDNNDNVYKLSYSPSAKDLKIDSPKPPINRDDDFYIDYTSQTPLNTWLKEVEKSDFFGGQKFNFVWHNCSHAATFALKIAGIHVFSEQQPYIYSLGLLTPNFLFKYAKNQKINQLPGMNLESIYRQYMITINIWRIGHQKSRKANYASKIQKGIQQRHKHHPEHTEAQVDVLIKTLNLLNHLPTDKEYQDYIRSANHFKKRCADSVKSKYLEYLLFNVLALECGFLTNLIMKSSGLPQLFSLGSSVATFFSARKLTSDVTLSKKSNTEQTELSESMELLADLQLNERRIRSRGC
jgi:hypothetical protein